MYGRWTPAVGILKNLFFGKRRTAIIGHEKLELISVTASQSFHGQNVGACRRIRFEDKTVHHGVKSRINHIGGTKLSVFLNPPPPVHPVDPSVEPTGRWAKTIVSDARTTV